ncbi:MAG: signal peptidase II [Candidatus Brocadiia bacterium]
MYPAKPYLKSLYLVVAVLAAASDQIVKNLVFSAHAPILFDLGDFFRIEHALNTGAVFGVGQGMNEFFTLLSAAFLVVMVPFFFAYFLPMKGNALTAIAGGLAYGGVMGNYIDRLLYGSVRDFITVYTWPTFNLADSCICVGVIYLSYVLIFEDESHGKEGAV